MDKVRMDISRTPGSIDLTMTLIIEDQMKIVVGLPLPQAAALVGGVVRLMAETTTDIESQLSKWVAQG